MLILSLAIRNGLVSWKNKLAPAGLFLLMIGFTGSELLLFLQGTLFWMAMGFMPWYHEALFVISIALPLGIGLFLMGVSRQHIPRAI